MPDIPSSRWSSHRATARQEPPSEELYPSLAAAYPDTTLEPWEAIPAGLDIVFIALPHGASQAIVPKLDAAHILDLGADFRLDDPALYPTWYGQEHTAPELLDQFAFGLPELFRSDIVGATAVAVPGCYVTTASLTLAPLLKAGLVEPTGIVVDAASGVSGAGRAAKPGTTFSAVDENFTAYGLLTHRHTPENGDGAHRRTPASTSSCCSPPTWPP